jgi:hypothetical protein
MNMDVLDPASDARKTSSSASLSSSFHSRRTADCKKWNPDMPELLGLYHAYVRGYNKDTRYAMCCQREREIILLITPF